MKTLRLLTISHSQHLRYHTRFCLLEFLALLLLVGYGSAKIRLFYYAHLDQSERLDESSLLFDIDSILNTSHKHIYGSSIMHYDKVVLNMSGLIEYLFAGVTRRDIIDSRLWYF